MKIQSLILLVVAAGCGLVAMLGVKQALSQKPQNAEETVQVLSAIAEIQPGEKLTDLDTKFTAVPVSSCPEGAVTAMEEVHERSLKVPVMPGDWILKAKLTKEGEFGVVGNIPEGMALIAIPVDSTTSHSGMLRPGHRVDLLLTFRDPATAENKTVTVLEFVKVVAVDDQIYGVNDEEGSVQAKNISLLVTPEQGKIVTLARTMANNGLLNTMLRPNGESDEDSKTVISQEFLLSSIQSSHRDRSSATDARYEDDDETESEESVAEAPVPQPVKEPSVDDLITQELNRDSVGDPGGSQPVVHLAAANTENTWTMEIYEGESIRLETIKLPETAAHDSKDPAGQWNIWDLWKSK